MALAYHEELDKKKFRSLENFKRIFLYFAMFFSAELTRLPHLVQRLPMLMI